MARPQAVASIFIRKVIWDQEGIEELMVLLESCVPRYSDVYIEMVVNGSDESTEVPRFLLFGGYFNNTRKYMALESLLERLLEHQRNPTHRSIECNVCVCHVRLC